MFHRATTARLILSFVGLAASGCAESHEATQLPDQLEGTQAELIGGVAANSPALNAIGTIGVTESYVDCYTGERVTANRVVCTASLIAERVVLSAKHCMEALSGSGRDAVPYFAIGPNAQSPTRVIEIVDMEASPVDVGGFNGYGRDVAVMYLAEPVLDVRPLRVAELGASAIGTRFGAIGFGVQDNAYNSGTRMAGSVTVNALEGRVYELIFGSYEAFRDWYVSTKGRPSIPGPRPPIVDEPDVVIDGGISPPMADGGVPIRRDGGIAEGGIGDGGIPDFFEFHLRQLYETTLLLPGYEAYVGNRSGDAQLCYGDSGGPLTRSVNGELYAYGVVSGGINSRELVCDFGAVYASFGPETVSFLEAARVWVDPCGGVSADGLCDGDVASRCTTVGEGKRRLTVTDCSLLGQTCAIGSDGRAACTSPGEPPVVLEEEDDCSDFPGFPPDGPIIDDEDVVSIEPLPDNGFNPL